MKISIIGTGNLAHFFALRLKLRGHEIVDVYGRNMDVAKEFAEKLNARALDDMGQMNPDVDVVVFAVPDQAIESVYADFPLKNKICIHGAGTVSVDVFNQSENAAVIWPLYSINKNKLPDTTESIPLFWEVSASTTAKNLVNNIVDTISINSREVGLKEREELHLSAVFVNNFVNHLMAVTITRMEKSRLSFSDSLKPIIEQTITTAFEGKSVDRQTGAAKRGDDLTMTKHLNILEGHPEWQEMYKAISTSIQNMHGIK